jgi:hypothetical protein
MPTIIELFKNKELLFPGGSSAEGAVKKESETFLEQETSGLRVKSAVEINNPLIYGNEAARIMQRSTPSLDTMKADTKGEKGDGGLIGKGLDKLTGGKVTSLQDAREKANGFMGIPVNQIPSTVVKKLSENPEHNSSEPVTSDYLGTNGTEFGKFLKSTGGGNPTTIGKQALGKGIGVAKDKLRGALFGKEDGLGEAGGNDYRESVEFTSNKKKDVTNYSAVKKSKRLKSAETAVKDLEGTQLDLQSVSPVYGIARKEPRIHPDGTNIIGNSRYNPTKKEKTYTGIDPNNIKEQSGEKLAIETKYGLSNKGDKLNKISPSDIYTLDDDDAFLMKAGGEIVTDFIPLWFKRLGDEKPIVFRAIISGLTESTSPSWSSNKFIGNPYSFHMYDGVERSVSFNIKIFAASPLEMSGVWERLKILTSYTYPTIAGGLTTPPIIDFRLGDIYSNRKALVDSLTYTIPDESNWETNGELGFLPKMVDIAISLKLIETPGDEERLYDMAISKEAVKGINDNRKKNREAISLASKTEKGASGDAPKETSKKKATVSILKGKAKTAKESLKAQKDKVNIFGKKKTETPSDTKEGVPNTTNQQSATADKHDGKSSSDAVEEKVTTSNTPETQASMLVSLSLYRKNMKEVPKSAISSDYKMLNGEDTNIPGTIFVEYDDGMWGTQYSMVAPNGTFANFHYDPDEEPFGQPTDDALDAATRSKSGAGIKL